MLYSPNSGKVFLNRFLYHYEIFSMLMVSLSSVEREERFKLVCLRFDIFVTTDSFTS